MIFWVYTVNVEIDCNFAGTMAEPRRRKRRERATEKKNRPNSPYTVESLSQAGITWEHIPGVSDRYLYRGAVIGRVCAEVVADFFFKKGRPPTAKEFHLG